MLSLLPSRNETEISPMRIEQVVGIEIDKPADQPAKSRLRGCNDRRLHQTDKRRQLVSL